MKRIEEKEKIGGGQNHGAGLLSPPRR